MFSFLRKLFGIEEINEKTSHASLQTEINTLRKELITVSNIVGKLATKVDSLSRAVNQQLIELDKLSKAQIELEYEHVSLVESLRSMSSPKNRLITFPLGKDDDDDLIN
jgi:chromosome segregation ATPase